ncbi:cytidylyltransferase domain-containing protein, partial [Acinetobacter baumannii]|uniref:cytidylyltransferase domain-containing protein n=1 Tax=Acinetobacter baumannii TaxID=470 RepID=UPI0031F47A15
PETCIVNIQGDEPVINPEHIDMTANLLLNSNAHMSTLCAKITNIKDVFDPNCVKVVMDQNGYALYFSRAPIPYERDNFKLEVIEDLE